MVAHNNATRPTAVISHFSPKVSASDAEQLSICTGIADPRWQGRGSWYRLGRHVALEDVLESQLPQFGQTLCQFILLRRGSR